MPITNPADEPSAQGKRITVTLIPKAEDDLRRLEERTKLSKTDLANRAITLYEFFDNQIRTGHDMLTRDVRTGTTKLVHLTDASAEQVTRHSAYQQDKAGDEQHPGRKRRRRPSPGRFHRPAIAAQPLLLIGLAGRETRTR